MLQQPKLTICVPSRNRQLYFQETIRSLLINLRTDVEFVFADNSDDPSIMHDFMVDILDDPRVKFLPSAERILPMNDNWERCLETATGDYVCVIGDDDYVDPNVADLLNRVCALRSQVDVFVWSRLTYNWPDNQLVHGNVALPLKTGVHKIKREHLFEEFFTWASHTATPNCPFSIYHGAVAKRVMDSNRARFGGRYFEHLTVDFETSCKLLVNAETFYYCERPFSILGACAASNSGTVGNPEVLKQRHAQIMLELGRNIDDDPYMKGFPFSAVLGIAASVAQLQQWFKVTYGIKVTGWEKNFAEACGYDCRSAKSRLAFDLMVEGYRKAFSGWHGGRFLPYFKPEFVDHTASRPFQGVNDDMLLMDERIGGIRTPAELYQIAEQVLAQADTLELKFMPYRKNAA